MPTIAAKDLSKEYPRSPLEELGGYAWLPRIIDKVRSLAADTLGGYIPYPCGGDQRFLNTFGLDRDGFAAAIRSGANDEDILAWVRTHQAPGAETKQEEFRQILRAPALPERVEPLKEYLAELHQERPDLDLSWVKSFTQAICAEEGHPFP